MATDRILNALSGIELNLLAAAKRNHSFGGSLEMTKAKP
jgi:hypothetical protein